MLQPEQWSEIADLIRRYAEAIAEKRISAKEIASMTDEQLKDYRKTKLQSVQEIQDELNRKENENKTADSK